MRNHLLFCSIILAFLPGLAVAQWKGVGEAGLIIVDGNSQSKTLNTSVSLSQASDRWEHSTELSATSSESENEKSAESYSAQWDTNYLLSERLFLFGDVRYFDDKFDSFESIKTAGTGVGYKVFRNDVTLWDISSGVGYRKTKLEESGDNQSGATFLATSKFSHVLTETTKLTNDTRIESAADNTFVQNKLGLSVAINSALALKLGYEVRYNSEPADGDESQDTITSVNLVYNF